MGRDKALLEWDGRTLLARALGALGAVCGEVAIVGGREDLTEYGRVIPDEFEDCGPLGGIHAALRQSHAEWNVVLAVDMPRIEAGHLRRLLEGRGGGIRVVMACCEGRLQPLCAVYHRGLAEAVGRALEGGERAVWRVMEAGCGAEGLARVEFGAADLLNVNEPGDLG